LVPAVGETMKSVARADTAALKKTIAEKRNHMKINLEACYVTAA